MSELAATVRKPRPPAKARTGMAEMDDPPPESPRWRKQIHRRMRYHHIEPRYWDGSEGTVHRNEISPEFFRYLNDNAAHMQQKKIDAVQKLPGKAARIYMAENKKRRTWEPENMEYLLKQHEEILKYYGADGINRPNVNYVLRLQHAENWRQALTARERDPVLKLERAFRPAGYEPRDKFHKQRAKLKQELALQTPGLVNPPAKTTRPDRSPIVKGPCFAPIPASRGHTGGYVGWGGSWRGTAVKYTARGPEHPDPTTFMRGNPFQGGNISISCPGSIQTARTAVYDTKAASRMSINPGSVSARGRKEKGLTSQRSLRSVPVPPRSVMSMRAEEEVDDGLKMVESSQPSEELLAEMNYVPPYKPNKVSSTFYLSPSLFNR